MIEYFSISTLLPLGLTENRCQVTGRVFKINTTQDRYDDLLQRERVRYLLQQTGWNVERVDDDKLVVTNKNKDKDFVKFIQCKPGTDSFEGLCNFFAEKIFYERKIH